MPDTSDILDKQLAMNRQTWAALQQHGVIEGSQLQLDFSYNALNRKAAERLCAALQQQTDFKVSLESTGSFFNRKWRLDGTTQKMVVSPLILDDWVAKMVTAGRSHSCDFDGWGTSV